MKRLFLSVVLIAALAAAARAGEFVVSGSVYMDGGGSGDASTPNSFASMHAYRLGVPGQVASQVNGEAVSWCASTQKIFASDGSLPAYFQDDIGDNAWDKAPVAVAAGQVGRVIIEVSATGNCYPGPESYISCTTAAISSTDVTNHSMVFPACQLKLLPAPDVYSTMTSIYLTWTGLDLDFAAEYNIYREEQSTGVYTYLGTSVQMRNSTVSYIDSGPGVDPAKTYDYRISVSFTWAGGGGAPDFYESSIRSKASAGVKLLEPTMTITPTSTDIVLTPTITTTDTPSPTYTDTQTYTPTATLSYTLTETLTETPSSTDTITPTPTYTGTPTITATFTATPVDSATLTATATPPPAATPAATVIEAASSIMTDKVIIFNNPIRDSMLKIGFRAFETGDAVIYLYNLNAELVRKFYVKAAAGPNIFERELKDVSSGVYILKIKVNGGDLPVRKIAIIK